MAWGGGKDEPEIEERCEMKRDEEAGRRRIKGKGRMLKERRDTAKEGGN